MVPPFSGAKICQNESKFVLLDREGETSTDLLFLLYSQKSVSDLPMFVFDLPMFVSDLPKIQR